MLSCMGQIAAVPKFQPLRICVDKLQQTSKLFSFDNRYPGKIHPTQKPVELYAWIYSLFAEPGSSVLDTHLGSGSSRIAAYDAGLDFVGCEFDKDYFAAQEKRFEEHTAQGNLFLNTRAAVEMEMLGGME